MKAAHLEHSGAFIVKKGTLMFIVKIIKDAFGSLFAWGLGGMLVTGQVCDPSKSAFLLNED